MKVTIRGHDEISMQLFPDPDSEQDIIQNILCILNTTLGSCPHQRNYGIDPDIMHKPTPVAKAAFSVAISEQMRLHEPRAVLNSISYEDDPDNPGVLNPVLEVNIP